MQVERSWLVDEVSIIIISMGMASPVASQSVFVHCHAVTIVCMCMYYITRDITARLVTGTKSLQQKYDPLAHISQDMAPCTHLRVHAYS